MKTIEKTLKWVVIFILGNRLINVISRTTTVVEENNKSVRELVDNLNPRVLRFFDIGTKIMEKEINED